MATYAVLSDIQGNFHALNRVLEKVTTDHDHVDEIICCGDVIGVLGHPRHCVHAIHRVANYTVFGNHDARVREDFGYAPSFPAAYDEHKIVTETLRSMEIDIIEEWPERIETDDFIVAHSWPKKTRDDDQSVTGFLKGDYGVKPRDATKAGKYANGKFVFLGHTHQQFEQSLDKFQGISGHIVNPGSVGSPWDEPAEYAIVDTDTGDISLKSVEYNYDLVENRLDELDEKMWLRTW